MIMSLEITINGIPVIPYNWQEAESERYVLTFDARLTNEQFERLTVLRLNTAKDRENFDVIINDYLKLMHFNEVLYSQHEDYVKVRATLIEKNDSSSEDRYLEDPSKENMLETIAELKLINEKLLGLLLEKDVVTEEEVSQITFQSEEEVYSNRFRFYEVEDIDLYDQRLKGKQPFFSKSE